MKNAIICCLKLAEYPFNVAARAFNGEPAYVEDTIGFMRRQQ